MLNVLKSTPSGCSVPVNVSVCWTGSGVVGLLPQPAANAAQRAITQSRRATGISITHPSLRGAGTPGPRSLLPGRALSRDNPVSAAFGRLHDLRVGTRTRRVADDLTPVDHLYRAIDWPPGRQRAAGPGGRF